MKDAAYILDVATRSAYKHLVVILSVSSFMFPDKPAGIMTLLFIVAIISSN